LPDEEVGGDVAGESETVVFGPGDVAEDTIGLFPMSSDGRTHVVAEEAENNGYIGASHVLTSKKVTDNGGEREGLDVERRLTEVS
jgi:hypothetical protein